MYLSRPRIGGTIVGDERKADTPQMAVKDSDRQMTIPELLKAREEAHTSLEALDNYPRYWRGATIEGGDPRAPLRAKLTTILQEIADELAEQEYKDAERPQR